MRRRKRCDAQNPNLERENLTNLPIGSNGMGCARVVWREKEWKYKWKGERGEHLLVKNCIKYIKEEEKVERQKIRRKLSGTKESEESKERNEKKKVKEEESNRMT